MMITYSKMCHEGKSEGNDIYDTRGRCANGVAMWGKWGWEVLHDETFANVGHRRIREGLADFSSAERTASGLNLGRVWVSCTHLANEVFKTRANVPILLGRGLVKGDTPTDRVAADHLLGHFAFGFQVTLGPYDNNWHGLMEEGGSGEGAGDGEEMMRWSRIIEEYVWFTLTRRSSPLSWYIRCRRSSISRKLVS